MRARFKTRHAALTYLAYLVEAGCPNARCASVMSDVGKEAQHYGAWYLRRPAHCGVGWLALSSEGREPPAIWFPVQESS